MFLHRSSRQVSSAGRRATLRLWKQQQAPCYGFSARYLHPSSGEGGGGGGGSSIEERGPYASRLKSRGVVRVEGEDTFRFLQGLVSNDLNRLQQEPAPSPTPLPTPNQSSAIAQPLYTALLNPQGRFLFDIFIYRPPTHHDKLDRSGTGPESNGESKPALLCDADASTLDELLDLFKKYKLRAKVEFEDLSKDLSVWQRYGGSIRETDSQVEDAEVENLGWAAGSDRAGQASTEANNKGYQWLKDPRLKALGFRGIFPSNTIPPLVEAGKEVEEAYFSLLRLEQGVPEGCSEIPKEKAIPLEYNLAWLNAISFEKGCYVGQELVARTQHRGVIRKRIMPINFVNEKGEELQQTVVPGAEIMDVQTNKKAGEVTTVLGCRGLGLIRLEAAQKSSSRLSIANTKDAYAILHRPKWWPQDWCPEELLQAANS